MDEGVPPPDAAALIHGVAALGHPRGDLLDRLVSSVEWLRVPAGRRLFSEGAPADGMYVLFEGRVRLLLTRSPVVHTSWDLDPVAVFGEGALLTGGGRSRTAVVVRDALLARVPPHMFEEVLHDVPGAAVAIARRVAHRTVFPGERDGRPSGCRLALVSTTLPTQRLRPLVDVATAALGTRGSVVVHGQEHQQTTLAATLRHSDRVVVVVDASSTCDVGAICEIARHGIDPLAAPTLELVLLHRATIRQPSGTAARLAGRGFSHHHHVREGVDGDLARFARHVSGTSVGLVLGGGGARGLAHIGVIRAMHELSIPIDTLGGSSMGAIIAGQCAMGWTWEEMLARNERIWTDRRLHWEVTVPTVSLFSGKRAAHLYDITFGDRDIEDFWLPCFATSVDLSAYRLAVHRRGPASFWIRASATVAGLWPPAIDADGHLHIDGGQLNNVPTDQMRDRHDGPIIAVDVFARQAEMTLEPGSSPRIGLRHLLPGRAAHRYPAITDTMNRCALLGSLAQQEQARQYADVYITPDLSKIGFRRFDRIVEASEVGYRSAMTALADWPGR